MNITKYIHPSAPMAILKNARHEKFAQNIAKGMSATQAYEKAASRHSNGSPHQRIPRPKGGGFRNPRQRQGSGIGHHH